MKKNVLKYFKTVDLSDKDIEEIHNLMIYDKKNEGSKINFVLLKSIGEPLIDQETSKELFVESFKFYSSSL